MDALRFAFVGADGAPAFESFSLTGSAEFVSEFVPLWCSRAGLVAIVVTRPGSEVTAQVLTRRGSNVEPPRLC